MTIKDNPIDTTVDEVDIDKRAGDITEQIYVAFASETGVLFGIPSDCRRAVRAVIKQVLKVEEAKDEIAYR